ncbi:MAG: hypothetical protein KF729_28620 [Sandaracinaceae bacterium]|nr:hypothetical protein [Sandaracinaceae bacterium]
MRLALALFLVACDGSHAADAGARADAASADAASADAASADAAISEDASGLDAGTPTGCPDSLHATVCSGVLDPSALGADIPPVPAGLVPGAPGRHFFCTSSDGAWNGRLLVYLVGTYGDPASEHAVPVRACERGFAAIAPMYENRHLVRSVCGDDGPCYERFRAAIVDGAPGAPVPLDVTAASSIRNRVATLLAHLASEPGAPFSTLRDALAAGDFSAVALAGHSQGAGHALYLARDEAAERVVMLAGPSDRLGDGTPTHAAAPWIAALAASPPRTALRLAYIHDDDSFQRVPQVVDNWDLAGVPAERCAHASAGGYPASCRRVHVDADRCGGLAAHLVPILAGWGARCAAGDLHRNEPSWDFLLEAGRAP